MSLFFKKICGEEYRIRPLDYIINHEYFQSFNLMRTKHIIPDKHKDDKVNFLYNLWKQKDKRFMQYLQGDVHDILLIAKTIFSKEISSSLF